MNIKQGKRLRYLVCCLAQVLASRNSKGGDHKEAPMFCLSKCLQGEGATQYEEDLPMEVGMPPDPPHCIYVSEGSLSSGMLQLRADRPQAFLHRWFLTRPKQIMPAFKCSDRSKENRKVFHFISTATDFNLPPCYSSIWFQKYFIKVFPEEYHIISANSDCHQGTQPWFMVFLQSPRAGLGNGSALFWIGTATLKVLHHQITA